MDPFVWGNHMELQPILFRYRARDLRAQDTAQVQAAIASHYARGRSFIARTLCELWDWRQPIGGYKEFAARDLLLRLTESGRIELPPRQRVKSNVSKKTYAQIPLYTHQGLSGTVGDFAGPVIEQTQGGHSELWDYLLHHYHYLGRPKLVGHAPQASGVHRWPGGGVPGVGERGLEDCCTGPSHRVERAAQARSSALHRQ